MAIKASLLEEGAKPRDIADALAEHKARKIAGREPGALVLGSDQVLEFEGRVFSKPESADDLKSQLMEMRGKTHQLHAAAVIYEDAAPVWRSVKTVRLSMRDFSQTFLDGYVARNWDQVRHAVGGYQIEAEGTRLFHQISGDYFAILGMPLLDVLSYLSARGAIDG